jgi:hypothetical protein
MTDRDAAVRRHQAELALIEWAAVSRSRDERVREAVASGISKNAVHQLTGIGRMTIDRILGSAGDDPSTAHDLADEPEAQVSADV